MRPQDWPLRLDAYVDAARAKAFVWGGHDCVSFAAGWYAIATGANPFAPFAGRYDSQEAALATMHAKGVLSMSDAGDYLFGIDARKAPERAQRGDIVLAENTLGVCVGARGAFPMIDGMRFALASKFQAAWDV